MSAEHSHQLVPEKTGRNFFRELTRRFKRPVIRGLDAYPLFTEYFADITKGLTKEEAHERFRRTLELNLHSYVQEGIGDHNIAEYGTEITHARNIPSLQETSDRIVFRDHKGNDTLFTQRENNRTEHVDHPEVITYFDHELASWEKTWNKMVAPIEHLIGEPDPETVIHALEKVGFRHIVPGSSPKELCEVSQAIHALFPELLEGELIEFYEHPDKRILASPRHPLHHQGETSIARLIRLVYIPKIHKFAFFERGLFTAYTDQEIATFFTLDGKSKPSFASPEEMLAYATILTQEFAALPPHAVFNHIIGLIGHFPDVPVGENVVRATVRTLDTQIAYIEQILAFEEALTQEHPTLLATQRLRLEHVLEPIEHSLLRANVLDVDAQVENYIRIFSDLRIAQNPRSARQLFRLGVLSSYPDFATRVGSILDCSTGSIVGGLQRAGGLGGLESVMGSTAFGALKSLEGRSVLDRHEFEQLARKLGKDPSKFTKIGVCACPTCSSKGLENYLGACNWCLACEVKDDLGIHGKLPDIYEEGSSENENGEQGDELLFASKLNVGLFVSSLFVGGVKNVV